MCSSLISFVFFYQGYFISLFIKLIYVLLGSLASFIALKLQKQCLNKAPKQTVLKETITSSPTLASQLPQASVCSTLGEHMIYPPKKWNICQCEYIYIYTYVIYHLRLAPPPNPLAFSKFPARPPLGVLPAIEGSGITANPTGAILLFCLGSGLLNAYLTNFQAAIP